MLDPLGWKPRKFTAKTVLDEDIVATDTHKIDFVKGNVAFDLECAATIDALAWTVVQQAASWTAKGKVYLRLPATEGAQFFRLHKL